jgi:hypothetical protein
VHVRVAGKDEACVCHTPRKLLVYLLHTLVISHESSMTTITRDSVLSEMLAPFGCADKPAEKHCWLICCERKILFQLKKQAEKDGL